MGWKEFRIIPGTLSPKERRQWHYVRIDMNNHYVGRHGDIYNYFDQILTARFFVDRTSKPGYWFESGKDAAMFKIKFG